MREEMQKILIDPDALTLIERILQSCKRMYNVGEEIRFKAKKVTLLEIFERYPVPALGLNALCQERKTQVVSSQMVIELFSGPIHAQAINERIDNPEKVMISTTPPQAFLKRMQEISVSLDNSSHRSEFALLDLALPGRIVAKKDRIVDIQSGRLRIKNCVLPFGIKAKLATWILIHFGMVITTLSEGERLRAQRIHQMALKILGLPDPQGTIDLRAFCGQCNLTELLLND